MSDRSGSLTRVLAFFRKDLFEVLRQPRLLITLVLGPFLILVIFGVGFAPDPPTLRTVLVVPSDSGLEEPSAELAERIGQRMELVETVTDEQAARDMLETGEADVVVVVPAGAVNLIQENRQSEIIILHDQIDPFERSLIDIFAASAVDQVNREVLQQLVATTQDAAAGVEELATFRNLSPEVLVSPFISTVSNSRGVSIDFSHYYVPGVVALLLQHLALTFAALSLVRERTLGTVELFRVSPLSGGETLIGKYLAYTLLGALIGAALTAAAVFGFGFEVTGSWWWFALICLLVLLAALGAGFVVSSVARTESEAVQYAMIMLLVAIFFSGFFISLDRLIPAVRVLSYLIPATYGISGLQEVAFRGRAPSLETLGGAALLAVLFLVTAWALIKTRVVAGIQPRRSRAKA
ncbi:MAG: ABC transporter permease [Acidimicrobiia bacterium]